jgi:hypothetical protein
MQRILEAFNWIAAVVLMPFAPAPPPDEPRISLSEDPCDHPD